jgi:hypothetical protein
MQVPFMIVKDKARLGALVHQKKAACVCLAGVDRADEGQLKLLRNLAMVSFNNNAELIRKWGGGKWVSRRKTSWTSAPSYCCGRSQEGCLFESGLKTCVRTQVRRFYFVSPLVRETCR